MSRPEWLDDDYPSYGDLFKSFGYEVLAYKYTGSYQGDLLALFADGNRRGILETGYGSCSGCDSLEAATPWSYSDEQDWSRVVELRDSLKDDIHWEDSAEELAAWLDSEVTKANRWWLNDDEIKEAIQEFKTLMGVGHLGID